MRKKLMGHSNIYMRLFETAKELKIFQKLFFVKKKIKKTNV